MPRKPVIFKGFRLNPFQIQAIDSIKQGHSVLVSAPTGAGKTLVAEYAIRLALEKGQRAIYTAPIKALSNQKFRDFRDDPDIDVGLMTGDVTINPNAPLLIMTTEIFRNTIFEAPERFRDVAFVIFDEIHYLDDPERGTVWEESLIFAPENIRLICLSATVQNLESFGAWIRSVRKQELEIILYEKRPVPLSHRLYNAAYGAFKYEQLSQVRRKVQNSQGYNRPNRGRQGGASRSNARRGKPRRDRVGIHQAGRMLLDELIEGGDIPLLYFCFSRRECEVKAERNSHRRLIKGDDRRKMSRLYNEICKLFQLDWQNDTELTCLRNRAIRGLGFHHAGMLPIHKEIVERLFTSGLLKLLFTTETFALGINMPAKTVIFDSLRKFDGVSFDYMKTRDYLQMAGRAGRQGIDKEGKVFSLLDNEDLLTAPLKRILLGTPEPIQSRFNLSYSTLINLFEHMGRGLVKAYEKSFSYFQSARGSKKKREMLRSKETARILRKLNVLEEAGYLDDKKGLDDKEGLLPRAKIARQINGYEIQITELLFQGVLDELDAAQLAAVFVSLVYQERRTDQMLTAPKAQTRAVWTKVEAAVRRFTSIEARHGFEDRIKLPEFGFYPATIAWAKGCDFEELEHHTTASGGDIVRTLRMAIQMLRQLQHALARQYPLYEKLESARISINRDVVDAKRQLELG